MDTFRPGHILVATDGSPRSLAAVAAAADLARDSRARLTIVTCTAPRPERSADDRAQLHVDIALTAAANAARERLQDAEVVASAHGVAAAVEHALAEEPCEGILETARARGCDLIVAASRGRGRAAGLLLGSETLGLLAHSTLPVLVCPGGVAPAWRHILVPIDGSEASESAVSVAADLARLHDGRVTLLMCSPSLLGAGELSGGTYERLARDAAGKCLASAAAAARARGVAAACEHAFTNTPWSRIVEAAETLGAGLICMASHKRSGRVAVTIASHALEVLTHARVAVLVCRAPEATAYPLHAARDPVCGMSLDPRKAAFRAEQDGTTHYFCSAGCRASFVAGARDPARISRWTKRGPPEARG